VTVLAVAPATPPAVRPWDGPGAVRARLEDEAATAVALLERFGDLLGVALDAAGRGDDAALEAAVGERAWVMAELGPLLASLAAARGRPRRAGGPRPARALVRAAGRRARALPAPLDDATLAGILDPVDDALRHARLLHERVADEVGRKALLGLVR
jgi:hypothetical protein